MKILIAYYSLTGNSKKVAEALAQELKADLEELIDTKKRTGFPGALTAGFDAMRRKETKLQPLQKDPGDYDLVIIGSPIWGFVVPAPAARTYLVQNKDKFKKVAFFLTKGGSPGTKTFADMSKACGQEPVATFEATDDEIKKNLYLEKLKTFTARLTKN